MRQIHVGLIIFILCIGMAGVAAADLPTSVNAKITYLGPSPSATSYWSVLINSQTPMGSDLRVGAPPYDGWCVDAGTTISPGTHDFLIYSSLNPSSMPTDYLKNTVNWSAINYILNHKSVANGNMNAIQAAIWHYDGGVPSGYGTWFSGPDYNAIIADTNANAGPSWTPGPGQVYGVVLYKSGSQIIIIEVPVPYINGPEFPSIYLPAGMLAGMIGVVLFIRRRD